jgi:nicotinate-nucleotide adenylyltransferase
LGVTRRCIALLGGSFDPVHQGHVALARHFHELLQPDVLRIIPVGNPWQKAGLHANAEDRVAMIRCAFDTLGMSVSIDLQEIQRHTATYTIETLKAIRAEVGPEASVSFLIGADQLQHLHTWHQWQQLFDYAHICAASRPGFGTEASQLSAEVRNELQSRTASPEQIRNQPCGLMVLANDLSVEISATDIRSALQRGEKPESLVPATVLDYIETHHLYKN